MDPSLPGVLQPPATALDELLRQRASVGYGQGFIQLPLQLHEGRAPVRTGVAVEEPIEPGGPWPVVDMVQPAHQLAHHLGRPPSLDGHLQQVELVSLRPGTGLCRGTTRVADPSAQGASTATDAAHKSEGRDLTPGSNAPSSPPTGPPDAAARG